VLVVVCLLSKLTRC